jgi:hypothetical protein
MPRNCGGACSQKQLAIEGQNELYDKPITQMLLGQLASLVDGFNLESSIGAIVSSELQADYATILPTFSPILGLSIALSSAARVVFFGALQAQGDSAVGSTSTSAQIFVDGVAVGSGKGLLTTVVGRPIPYSSTFLGVVVLAAGTHLIELRGSAGPNTTLTCQAASKAGHDGATLLAIEVG